MRTRVPAFADDGTITQWPNEPTLVNNSDENRGPDLVVIAVRKESFPPATAELAGGSPIDAAIMWAPCHEAIRDCCAALPVIDNPVLRALSSAANTALKI